MPAKRKAAGKQEVVEGTRRSSRNASASTDSTAGTKRKASPSPVSTKRAASTKKGRTQSPSPAPDNRKSSRGRQVPVQKEDTKPSPKTLGRSTSQRGRVTRTVVQEVDTKKSNASKQAAETKKKADEKKPSETKSRSLSRAAKSPVPQKQPDTPKQKASTPKPKVETPKQRVATPRGRATTPRQQKESPKKDVSPKPKTTPKRNASPKKQKPQAAKKSPSPKSETKQKKESPVRPSRSRRSRQSGLDEKNDEEVLKVAEEKEGEDVASEENVTEESSVNEGNSTSVEAIVADDEEIIADKPEETTESSEDVNTDEQEGAKAEDQEESVKSVEQSAKNDSENDEEKGEESMETEDIDDNMDEKEVEEVQNNESEKISDSICTENQKEMAANDGDENEEIVDSTEKESAVKDNSPSDSVEVIGDTKLKPSTDVAELKEDVEEIPVMETEPAIVNNISNVVEEAGGSGDQVVQNIETVEKSLEADLSNDAIQEVSKTVTEENGGQHLESVVDDDIQEIDINQDATGANNTDDLDDKSPNKRKFEDVEQEDATSPLKRPRIAAEKEIQENGAVSCEDVAKDYVVIEMGDVPQPESSEVLSSLPNPIFNRPFIPNPAFSGSSDISKHFSIASYNMLADCHLFRNDYSFTDAKYLQPEYRLGKVIEEIRYLDADIVCMQEVDPDYYSKQLQPSLKSLGYDGLFKKRMKDYYKEGEATFYKTSRFTLVKSTLSSFSDLVEKELTGIDPLIQDAVRAYMNLPDVIVITKLRCNTTGQEVTVGNVHIQWGEMKVPDAQCVQITCAVKEVYMIASAVKEIVSNADGDVFPHIICGDFNSPPMSPGYLVARDGYPSGDETINKLMQIDNLELPEGKKASLVNSLWPAFQHTSSSLRSAYSEAQGYESEVSSFNRVMCDCVDYIFYSSMSLDNVGVLQMASKEKITETGGIPNCYFPSDHVSIKAVLSFK